MDGATFWILAVTAAVFVGMSKGGLSMAGTVSVPLLALVISPVTAAGLLLPVYVVSDMFGLYAYRHEFNRRVVLIIAGAATIGIALGWATAAVVDETQVKLIVGLIGLGFVLTQGWKALRKHPAAAARPARLIPGLFWGTVTGFVSFVSHSGAPPYQVYTLPLGMRRTLYAGTATVSFAYINAAKLVPYWALGQLSAENLKVAALLALPAALAVFLGMWLVKVMSDRIYYRLITGMLALLSIKLIWDALTA